MSIEELRLLNKKMEEDINSAIDSHRKCVANVRKDYEEIRHKFIQDNSKFPKGFKFTDTELDEWVIVLVHFSGENGFEYTVQTVDINWKGEHEQTYLTESELEAILEETVPQPSVESLILEKCNKLRFLFDNYVSSCKRIEEEFNEKINKIQR